MEGSEEIIGFIIIFTSIILVCQFFCLKFIIFISIWRDLLLYSIEGRTGFVGLAVDLKKINLRNLRILFLKILHCFFFLTETLNPHIIKGIYYFLKLIYFWRRWVFVSAHGLSLVAESGGYSSLQCAGFSLQWLLLLWSTGSRCAGFSSCGTQAQ